MTGNSCGKRKKILVFPNVYLQILTLARISRKMGLRERRIFARYMTSIFVREQKQVVGMLQFSGLKTFDGKI